MTAKPPPIPLPDAWPEHTKSALLHAVALAHRSLVSMRGWCANSPVARVRLTGENERLRSEVAMLRDELRIKDARMAKLAPARRPQYAPTDRLAILQLKAARGWNKAQCARVFLVTAATIALWLKRLDEDGERALVRTPEPVNRFPDFVTLLVQQLKVTFPVVGKRRIADMLARAGVHLAATTVARMLARKPVSPPAPPSPERQVPARDAGRTVVAKYVHHVWGIDLTLVPTSIGFWIPWSPWSVTPSWPFCWHVVVVLDQFSRKVVHVGSFRSQPTAAQMCSLLDEAVAKTGRAPRYTVTDRGAQFQGEFRHWCADHGVKPRFGAIGKKGSIAIVERFMLTLKDEGTRRIAVPYDDAAIGEVLSEFARWYNEWRPHSRLGGATPCEIFEGVVPAHEQVVFEMRPHYPLPEVEVEQRDVGRDANALQRAPPSVIRVSGLRVRHEPIARLPHLPRLSIERAA